MAQTILYYPKINIQDGAWLRNALLYWDEISSIVPYENYTNLSPELLYLQNLGIYHAIYPQNLFFSDFSEDFCNCIVKRIEINTFFQSVNPRFFPICQIGKNIAMVPTKRKIPKVIA